MGSWKSRETNIKKKWIEPVLTNLSEKAGDVSALPSQTTVTGA